MDQTKKPPEERERKRAPRGSLFHARAVNYAMPHDLSDPLRLLKANELAVLLNVHPMTVWSWASKKSRNGFPKPLRLGPQIVCWRAVDVLAWLDARAAETDERPPKRRQPASEVRDHGP